MVALRIDFAGLIVGAEMAVPTRAAVESIAEKVFETIERTEHLTSLVPADRLPWQPQFPGNITKGNDLGHLLGHLLDTLSGFCAVFYAAFPAELADFVELRSMPVNQSCSPAVAGEKMKAYAVHIERGFRCCTDADLPRRIPTIFVPEGETLLTLLLGNLEHLMNHKYQLFFYLKLAGLPVSSQDIYKWRGASRADATPGPGDASGAGGTASNTPG